MAEHTRFERLVTDAKKRITEISPADAAAKSQSGEAGIVDVREKDEWDEEHIPGAIHMSRGTIELDIEDKVPDTNAMIVCHCGGCRPSSPAVESLLQEPPLPWRRLQSLASFWCANGQIILPPPLWNVQGRV